MKCYLCKYIHAVEEALKHTNGTTVFVAESLRKRLSDDRRHKVCEQHKSVDAYNADLFKINTTVSKTELTYVPLEQLVPKRIVWTPKGERV